METTGAGLLGIQGAQVTDPVQRAKFLHVLEHGDYWPRLQHLFFYIKLHTQCDDILDFLITNRITGSELVKFFRYNDGSILQTLATIVKYIEKTGTVRPIYFGRDIR